MEQTTSSTIEIYNPIKLPTIDFKLLVELQEDFKKSTPESIESLKNSILQEGFRFPKFVWLNDDKTYILDGHQTKKALEELAYEGYDIPEIPIVPIPADNRDHAISLLFILNSRFGDVDPGSDFLLKYMELLAELRKRDIVRLPEVKIPMFEIPKARKEATKKCPKCGFEW